MIALTSSQPIEVFISYAHDDERLKDCLLKHLALLKREELISTWHDRRIVPGEEWADEIDEHLNSAGIILLLVSASFIASDYCWGVEVQRAMERHEAGECRVIPVILRPCDWHTAPFGKVQGLPKDVRPVTNWPDRDDAFKDVARGISKAVREMQAGSCGPSPGTGAGAEPDGSLPSVWNVPHRRNRNFTGRQDLLQSLEETLGRGQVTALTQAITGLGGVGKTQLAVEYAYRRAPDYDVVWWVRSEEAVTLAGDYAELARRQELVDPAETDLEAMAAAVRRWLDGHGGWLLVFDNAPGPDEVLSYLPQGHTGHVLITSRCQTWRGTAQPLPVPVWPRGESVRFLLKRTDEEDEEAADQLAHALGDLPLALEQAGAYVEATGGSLARYLELFEEYRRELLADWNPSADYPETVLTTWDLSFRRVREESPAGADLLCLCAFLAPDDIPRGVLSEGAGHLPETLADGLAFDRALAALRRYSLLEVGDEALGMHRLVQAVARDRLDDEARRQWAEAAVQVVNDAFPFDLDDPATWDASGRLLPHALATAGHSEKMDVAPETGSRLLNEAGSYLHTRAQFAAARDAFARVLCLNEAAFGLDHPTVARDVNNLGSVLYDMGDLPAARLAFERALRIFEKVYGEDHPNVATLVNNLGSVLHDMGDLPAARDAFERALGIFEKVYGEDHPRTRIARGNLEGLEESA